MTKKEDWDKITKNIRVSIPLWKRLHALKYKLGIKTVGGLVAYFEELYRKQEKKK